MNGGACIDFEDGFGYSCICPSNFTGDNCATTGTSLNIGHEHFGRVPIKMLYMVFTFLCSFFQIFQKCMFQHVYLSLNEPLIDL